MGVPPTIEVANLGMADSLILMVMALVVFGPRRLPQIGRQIGKLMYEFRKASNDFKFQMEEELRNAEDADRRKKEEEERQRQLAANPPAQLEASATPAPELPATESIYPYGGTYGEVAEAQAQAEATYPTIQPPSTGEPVPAAWPVNETPEAQESSVAVQADSSPESSSASEAIAEEPLAEKENAVIETAVEEANKATEPAHNG
jgi:sec-independent protein translocase protein TatB